MVGVFFKQGVLKFGLTEGERSHVASFVMMLMLKIDDDDDGHHVVHAAGSV